MKKTTKTNKANNAKEKRNRAKMPLCSQTVQKTIPIGTVHDRDNLIEAYPGAFSRMYSFSEINFSSSPEEEKESIMKKYKQMMNSFGINMEISVTIINRNIDMDTFCEETLLKLTGDKYDYLREQFNQIIVDRILKGKNALRKDKYITLTLHAKDLISAREVFDDRLDNQVNANFRSMMSGATPVSMEDRLSVIHDIYNMGSDYQFQNKTKVIDARGQIEEVSSFEFENIRRMGISVGDILAPSSIIFHNDYIELGSQYARVMHIPITNGYDTELSDDFFTKITDMPFNMVTTINIKPIPAERTKRIVKEKVQQAQELQAKAESQAARNHTSPDLIAPAIKERTKEALEMRESITEKSEKLFETTFTIILYAENITKLNEYTDMIVAEGKKHNVNIIKLTQLQEEGFLASLPIGFNPIKGRRTLTSTALSVIIPFANLEVLEKGGINYSLNAISKQLILYDRTTKPNFNGFILGSAGSGKSFTAKQEIFSVFLGKDSDIMIIDPEREYVNLTETLDGQVVVLSPSSKTYINPLDISRTYEWDGEQTNPILEKASFIMKLFESMLNKTFGLDSIQKTLIDMCLLELYEPFCENGRLVRDIPKSKTPTLNNMKDWFKKRSEPEARELYYTLLRYGGNGTLSIFSHHTNVELSTRLIDFDISCIGEELKLMAMTIIQDAMWQRLVENRKIAKYTYIYVDECHLFFQNGNDILAEFLKTLWKRARKYNGVPTGISQSVEDMIGHPEARKLLSECNFIQCLAQQSADAREIMRETIHISESNMDYITINVPGQGLFYTGTTTIPFYSEFPMDNDIFPILDSNANRNAEYRERKRRKMELKKKQEKQNSYSEML